MADTLRLAGRTHRLSDWHAASLRPWEEGVYEFAGTDGRYSCWNGRQWMRPDRTPLAAARQTVVADAPPVAWRGLAAPSGQRCPTCKGHSVIDFGVDPDSQDDLIGECPDCWRPFAGASVTP